MNNKTRIRPKDRDALLQPLRAGVVPRRGQHHIQVGRAKEVEALLKDIVRIADGGSAVRFIIGEYGSGKTFFLNLIRAIGLEKKLISTHADLNPDRRLHASGGQARSLYMELMHNLSTRSKPEGGALNSIVERFIGSAVDEARQRRDSPETVLRERLESLRDLVGGFEFADVIAKYWQGFDQGNDTLKTSAVRWLRGEFSTKTDARKALGVRSIIDDLNFYDQLKLMARFFRLAGYQGFLICLDEMVNLYKLSSTRARNSNYEQILRILNDCLQGTAEDLGFLFGGTPEFLYDPRKGLYSYEALHSRLAENSFASAELLDFSGPVLTLASLAPEDLYVLLQKLRHVYAFGDPQNYLVPDEALHAFLEHCHNNIGEAYFRTPRNTVIAFINLLAILEQNPQAKWEELIGTVQVSKEQVQDDFPIAPLATDDHDELTGFRL